MFKVDGRAVSPNDHLAQPRTARFTMNKRTLPWLGILVEAKNLGSEPGPWSWNPLFRPINCTWSLIQTHHGDDRIVRPPVTSSTSSMWYTNSPLGFLWQQYCPSAMLQFFFSVLPHRLGRKVVGGDNLLHDLFASKRSDHGHARRAGRHSRVTRCAPARRPVCVECN